MLYKETVSSELLDLLRQFFAADEISDFVLVGGTALALQIGHRKSIDIDLFTPEEFDAERILDILRKKNFQFRLQNSFKGGMFGHINNIKTDFIRHAYPWVVTPIMEEGIRFASLEDIAAMKLNAITGNGTRLKDFADIAFLSERLPLFMMLDCYEKKYPDVNGAMALKSLCYFDDIDFSVKLDFVNNKINWDKIEKRITEMVRKPKIKFKKFE